MPPNAQSPEKFRRYRQRLKARGLRQIQTNRILTLRTERIGSTVGRLDQSELVELNRLLALAIGLA